jgi:hypothetical protein
VYSITLYVIQLVSELGQVGSSLQVLGVPISYFNNCFISGLQKEMKTRIQDLDDKVFQDLISDQLCKGDLYKDTDVTTHNSDIYKIS